MSELPPDEASMATAAAARPPEQAGGGTNSVADCRGLLDRERKRRASVGTWLTIASFERAVTTLARAAP